MGHAPTLPSHTIRDAVSVNPARRGAALENRQTRSSFSQGHVNQRQVPFIRQVRKRDASSGAGRSFALGASCVADLATAVPMATIVSCMN